MTNQTKVSKIETSGVETEMKDLGKVLSIMLNCKGRHSPKNEVICYVGNERSTICTKNYGKHNDSGGTYSVEVRKSKQINVTLPGLMPDGFRDVREFFTYMVENRGYVWVRQ